MFFAGRRLIAAGVVGLALSAAAQASAATPQAASKQRSATRDVQQAHLAVLDRPSAHFARSIAVARREIQRARKARDAHGSANPAGGYPTPESVGVSSATLDSIASCESGGDPTAVSADGTYRGKYQFDYGTWASVGGSGDPAAAPVAEQDYRAALLYSRGGSSPWPICG